MSDTPRTDAACGWPVGNHGRLESSGLNGRFNGPFVSASVARELERENAALQTELDATRKLLDSHMLRSDLFSYLAWLEDHRDHGDFSVKGKDYLVLASDNTTCWGRTFMEAVQIAEQHDRKLIDAARRGAKPCGDDQIMRQHLSEGGTPT